MASSHFFLFLGLLSTVGISLSFAECASKMAACMSDYTSLSGVTDIAEICKALGSAMSCLDDLKSQCDKAEMDTYNSVMGPLHDAQDSTCGGHGGGHGGGSSAVDCTVDAYAGCETKATSKDICPAYKCVQDVKIECDGKGFDDFYNKYKEVYDKTKAECGCSMLRPSVLALLATALIVACKSFF